MRLVRPLRQRLPSPASKLPPAPDGLYPGRALDALDSLCKSIRRWQYKSRTSVDGPWDFTKHSHHKEGDGQACPGGSNPAQYRRAKRPPATTDDGTRPSQEAATAMRVRPRSGKILCSPKTRARVAIVEPAYVFASTTSAKARKTSDAQSSDDNANIQSPTQGASTPCTQAEMKEEMGSTTPSTAHSAAAANPQHRGVSEASWSLLRQQHWTCHQDKGAVVDRGTHPIAVLVSDNVEAAAVEGPPPLRKSADPRRGSEAKAAATSRPASLPRA